MANSRRTCASNLVASLDPAYSETAYADGCSRSIAEVHTAPLQTFNLNDDFGEN